MANPEGNVLRYVAAFKLIKAAVLVVVGVGLVRLAEADPDRRDAAARTLADKVPLASHVPFVHRVAARARDLPPARLEWLAAGTFAYAAVFAVEGVGLLRRRRWAEWMVVVTTAGLLPVEVYELIERPTAARAMLVAANVAVVAYLVRLRVRDRPRAGASGARDAGV